MKIVWLEDEPETIEVIVWEFEDTVEDIDIEVCQTFNNFTNKLSKLEDSIDNAVIIDIRMNADMELSFNCNNKPVKITNRLTSGFEYYNNCIRDRFKNIKTIFYSSKPLKSIEEEAREHLIDIDLIVTKENSLDLIKKIVGGSK